MGMKRNWKRILALLLTAAMVFTMNIGVFAAPMGIIDGQEVDMATLDPPLAEDSPDYKNAVADYQKAHENDPVDEDEEDLTLVEEPANEEDLAPVEEPKSEEKPKVEENPAPVEEPANEEGPKVNSVIDVDPVAVTVTNWTVTYGDNPATDEQITNVDGGTVTFKDADLSASEFTFTADSAEAPALTFVGDTNTVAVINVTGPAAPYKINVGDTGKFTVKTSGGAKLVTEGTSGLTVLTAQTSGEIDNTATTLYVATPNEITNLSEYVSIENGRDKFTLVDGYTIASNETAANGSFTQAEQAVTTVNPGTAYALNPSNHTNTGLVKFTVAPYGGGTELAGLTESDLDGVVATSSTLTFNIKANELAPGSYNLFLAEGDDSNPTVPYYIEPVADAPTPVYLDSENNGIKSGTTYAKMTVSALGVISNDTKTITLGATNTVDSITSLKTLKEAPDPSKIFVDTTAKLIKISSNQAGVGVVVVKADNNTAAKEIAEVLDGSKYTTLTANPGDATFGETADIYVDDNDANRVASTPETLYFVYAVALDTGSKASELVGTATATGPQYQLSANFGSKSGKEIGPFTYLDQFADIKKALMDSADVKVYKNGKPESSTAVLPEDVNVDFQITKAELFDSSEESYYEGKKISELTDNKILLPAGTYSITAFADGTGIDNDNYVTVDPSAYDTAKFTVNRKNVKLIITADPNVVDEKHNEITEGSSFDFTTNVEGVNIDSDLSNIETVSFNSDGKCLGKVTSTPIPLGVGTHYFGISRNHVEVLNYSDGVRTKDNVSKNFIITNDEGKSQTTITVVKASGDPATDHLDLTIKPEMKDKLYFNSITNDNEFFDYFDVSYKGTKLTKNGLRFFVASDNKVADGVAKQLFAEQTYTDLAGLAPTGEDGKSYNVSANKTLYVGVSSNSLQVYSNYNNAPSITIMPQPIVIQASEPITSLAGKELEKTYKGKVNILRVDRTLDKNGNPVFDELAGAVALDPMTSNKWTTSINAGIEADGVDNTVDGTYDVALKADLNTEKAKNYVLFDNQKYSTYIIKKSLVVTFEDLLSGKTLSANAQYIDVDAADAKITVPSFNGIDGDTYSTAVGSVEWSIKINAETNDEKYQRFVNLTGTPVVQNGKSVGVEFDLNNAQNKVLKDLGSVTIYAKFNKDTQDVAKKAVSKKDANFSIDFVSPVFYTGEKLVATDDEKNRVKKGYNGVLDVDVRYNGELLTFDEDYTLSYKNNVNAAKMSDKKAPKVTAKGKGKFKGLTAEITYTILPADFGAITKVDMKNTYVKYTGKDMVKVSKAYVVYTSGSKKGKKVAKKGYDIKVYDAETDKLAGSPDKNAAYHLYYAVATANGKDKNFTAGGKTEKAYFWGIPKNSKKLKISGVTKNVDYNAAGVKLADFVDVKTATAKIGKKTILLSDNKTLSVVLDDADKELADIPSLATGTYYVAVGPVFNDKDLKLGTLSGDNVFEPTYVKVTHKGKKLSKSVVKLEKTSFDYTGKDIVLNFQVKKDDVEPDKIKIYGIRDTAGGEEGARYGSTSIAKYDVYLGTLKDFSNGMSVTKMAELDADEYGIYPDSYSFYVEGDGLYSGGFVMNYKIKPVKYKTDGDVKVSFANPATQAALTDAPTLEYNAAGYDWNNVLVKMNDKPLYPGWDYSLTWKSSKVGENGGSVTIKGTGKRFTGSTKLTFNIKETDLSGIVQDNKADSTEETAYGKPVYLAVYSKLYGAKSLTSKVIQTARTYDADGGVKVVSKVLDSKDYTATFEEAENSTSGTATITAKSKFFTGSKVFNYDVYAKDVTSVAITLSDNGKVSTNEAEIAALKTYPIDVTKVVVTFSDKKTETFEGIEAVKGVCDISYEDNDKVTTKAKVKLTFKNGKKYPTNKTYWKYYTIYKGQ